MKSTSKRVLSKAEKDAAARIKRVYEAKKDDLNLTQDLIGDRFGRSQGVVTQYLNGHIPLNTEAVLKFAVVLGESPMMLAPEIVGQFASVLIAANGRVGKVELPPDKEFLMEAYDALSAEAQGHLREFLAATTSRQTPRVRGDFLTPKLKPKD